MEVQITIKNYRCFPDENPVRICLKDGFTAFLGSNNSGKSSLLKFFFEFRQLFEMLSPPNMRQLIKIINGNGQTVKFMHSVFDKNEVFNNTNKRNLEFYLHFPNARSGKAVERLVLEISRQEEPTFSGIIHAHGRAIEPLKNGRDRCELYQNEVLKHPSGNIETGELLQVLSDLHESIYIGSFRNVINVGGVQDYFDISVGNRFVDAWRQFKSGETKSHNEAAHAVTEDIKNIFHLQHLEINPSGDGSTLQMLINGKSYRLDEVGSGLAQFIIVLINVAIKEPPFVLIDEPELNLHPSLQLDFLTTLGSYAKKGVIFATHSVGLARSAADQIYSFKKVEEGKCEVRLLEDTLRLPQFLGELSFSGYTDLGFVKILLVEGPTDIKTIQQFLRKYGKDHKIVLLHLGGSGMINGNREAELQEIKRISANVAALIDSERTTESQALSEDRQGFVDVCNRLEFQCKVLDHRATENYLSDRAVKLVKGEEYSALEPFQDRRDAQHGWSKSENWRIAREMTPEELDATDLGDFLKKL